MNRSDLISALLAGSVFVAMIGGVGVILLAWSVSAPDACPKCPACPTAEATPAPAVTWADATGQSDEPGRFLAAESIDSGIVLCKPVYRNAAGEWVPWPTPGGGR